MLPKKLLFVAGLLCYAPVLFSQVGINTTAPDAQLEIRSSSQATPAPTDGILIPRIDAFPATNPSAAQQGMMVYLTIAAGTNQPGFYYWDQTTTSWVGILSSAKSDADWFEEGATNAPNAITDDMYHLGNVAVGKNIANYPLEVDNATFDRTVSLNTNYSGASNSFGIVNTVAGSSAGQQVGLSNSITNSGNGSHIALQNTLAGAGSGTHWGLSTLMGGAGTGSQVGELLQITNSGNGAHVGSSISLSGAGSGQHTAISNNLGGNGTGQQTAITNNLANTSDSNHLAIINSFSGDGNGARSGVANFFTGIGSGSASGFSNSVTKNGNGNVDGFRNAISGSGSGTYTGFGNNINKSGNGVTYGLANTLSGTSTGSKIGVYNYIDPAAGGAHTGLYAEVLKAGAGNYAAYLLGNVSIGTTGLNNYILPPSRGSSDEIMQTDAFGNVSWKNPNTALNNYAWGTIGNSLTNPATHFVGTSDNQPLVFRTNNVEHLRITNSGSLGLGTTSPQAKLHVFGGASGMTPNVFAGGVIEGTGFTYLNVLSASETGVVFGSGGNATNGGIVYNSGIYSNGMNFRTGGNQNRMSISATGQVSIGNALANARLQVISSNQSAPANTDGIIIPKIDVFPATNPTAAQLGMMVYLTTAVGTNNAGFYYWDGSAWISFMHGGSGWATKGNAGTNAATNFIGTTDDNDVVFKRNNLGAGKIGATNTAFGVNTLTANTGGNFNVAIGTSALAANDNGDFSVAMGYNALFKNKADASVGVGVSALENNTSGQYNTAIGTNTLHTNDTGNSNTATGYNALYDNIGSYNTAVGVSAVSSNSVGESNVGVGFEALRTNKTGSWNTALGSGALFSNFAGEQNTAVGQSALRSSASGIHNVSVGMNSLYNNTAGSRNTALGTGALYWHDNGSDNTALGMEAMNNQTAGSNNIAVGKGANVPVLTGSDQLSIGNVVYGTGMNTMASARIGIADNAPDAKLEITASNATTPANTDGILIPRVSAFPVINPTAAQNGMMIFLTTTLGQYVAGFYYWDHAAASWVSVGSKSSWSISGNSGTTPVTNFIGTNDNAALAFRTNGSERMRVSPTGDVGIKTANPTAELEVNGFTKLGSTAPAVKMIKLTGTTAATQGLQTLILHGLTSSKILGVSIFVEQLAGSGIPPNYTTNAGYEYEYFFNSTSVVVWPKAGNSGNILLKPIRVLVTYEE